MIRSGWPAVQGSEVRQFEMALKYQVENLEGIDEAAQAFYTEAASGGYVLQVEGVVPQGKFNEVNQRAIDNATEAQRRRKTVERVLSTLGLESADGLDDALAELKKGKAKNGDDQEAVIAQIRADAEARIAEADKKYTGVLLEGAVSETKAALVGAGFPGKVAEMLAKTSRDRLKVDDSGKVRIIGAEGNILAGSGSDGHATYGDLAKELAAAMPELLVDTGKGGGGKPPASGGKASAKTVTRAEFDAMSQLDRRDFSTSGGKVVDG